MYCFTRSIPRSKYLSRIIILTMGKLSATEVPGFSHTRAILTSSALQPDDCRGRDKACSACCNKDRLGIGMLTLLFHDVIEQYPDPHHIALIGPIRGSPPDDNHGQRWSDIICDDL